MVNLPGSGTGPYVIAAADFNHNGSVALGRRLVVLAAANGAHAIKFSMRRMVETMAPETLDVPWLGAPELGSTHREVWRRFELTPRDFLAVRREARNRIAFVVAPHDFQDFAIGERLQPDAYQIDPPSLGNHELLNALARSGKAILLVAAMCDEKLLEDALRVLKQSEVVILHAISAVPLDGASTRLGLIPWLKQRFKRPVGYLGWESGISWALVAATLGAEIIEKPFTIDREFPGPHHGVCLNPDELRAMAAALADLPRACRPQQARRVLGEEVDVLATLGCSIVARRRLRRGTRLQARHLMLQSPLRGLSPRLWHWVEGKRLLYDLEAGEPLTFGLIE